MSDWLPTLPAVLAALGVLWLPGSALGAALGLRGLTLLGLAPVLSSAVAASVAVIVAIVGVSWSPLVMVIGTVAVAAVGWITWRFTGRWVAPHVRTPRRAAVVLGASTMVALVIAAVLQARRVVTAIHRPDAVAQTFDTSFHLNSVQLILDSGDASTLHMTVASPQLETTFYPGLWHALCALVVQISGTDVPTAANVLSVVIACLVWPCAMIALARSLFGARPTLLVATAFASFAFTQFPNRLLGFGILYPNLLAYALLPGVLAAVLLVLWRARGVRRTSPLVVLAAGLLALAVAQPNALFALGYVVIPLGIQYGIERAGRHTRRGGRRWIAGLWVVGVPVGYAAVYWLVGRIALVAEFRQQVSWPVRSTPGPSIRDALDLSALHPTGQPNVPVAILVVVGFCAALVIRRLRWVSLGYVILVALYVVVMSLDAPLRAELTGYWYADPQRLASLLPLLGVPLAALGAGVIMWSIVKVGLLAVPRTTRSRAVLVATVASLVVGTFVSLVAARSAVYQESFSSLSAAYRIDPESESSKGLVDAHEYRLMEELAEIVPEDVVVVGNPWDGSALSWGIADRQALFPHMNTTSDPDRLLIATQLNKALENPAVCEAVDRQGVGYALRMGRHLWGGDPVGYEGLDGLVEAGVGRLVAQEGNARLYEITACD